MRSGSPSASVWTLGHSCHDWPKFQSLLEIADITALADVRSRPSSRLPHFNRAALKERLNASVIAYIFLGLELGGLPNDGAPADYERMATKPLFLEGLSRVEEIAPRARLALMCSEHEPLTCHRCLLVGRRLVERGVGVNHILRDGRVETHADTEERLLKVTRQTEYDLLASRAERLARAYRDQNQRLSRRIATQHRRPKPSQ